MADIYTIYNCSTNRRDISTENLADFIKKFQNQVKRGCRTARYMVWKANGKTYYRVDIRKGI